MKDLATLLALIVIVICLTIAAHSYMVDIRNSQPVKVYPAEEAAPDVLLTEPLNYYNSSGWGYYPNPRTYQSAPPVGPSSRAY